ncbi:Ubiquitin-conjugating enzyme E2, partial [Dillenia turbinata]
HFKEDPLFHCSCGPINQDDYFHWTGAIIGPSKTPYEGGVFFLSIKFTDHHPFRPPIIKFQTKIYHPSVDHEDGTVRLDLLGHPNPDQDPYNPISNLYKNDRNTHNKVARMWTRKNAVS